MRARVLCARDTISLLLFFSLSLSLSFLQSFPDHIGHFAHIFRLEFRERSLLRDRPHRFFSDQDFKRPRGRVSRDFQLPVQFIFQLVGDADERLSHLRDGRSRLIFRGRGRGGDFFLSRGWCGGFLDGRRFLL